MSILESVRRANSCFRYYAYRRSIGNPVALRTVLREWINRYRFERAQRRTA